jgi:hypothetical protein
MNLWEPLWSPVTTPYEFYTAQILAATLFGAL